jgi:hypothetical protein
MTTASWDCSWGTSTSCRHRFFTSLLNCLNSSYLLLVAVLPTSKLNLLYLTPKGSRWQILAN